MKGNYNQFLAVVYADLFDWPLTLPELQRRSINAQKVKNRARDRNYKRLFEFRDSYFFIKGREKNILHRKKREIISAIKEEKALQVTKYLERIPTIEGIFLTGSVAAGNAKVNADIDLLIVTSPGYLWISRLLVVLLLKILGVYRDSDTKLNDIDYQNKICPNIFLDTDNMQIRKKNLYTANEVIMAKCLFDRGGVAERWMEENKWVCDYLPGIIIKSRNIAGKTKISDAKVSQGILKQIAEEWAFEAQYRYMKGKITNEEIGRSYAFFHPRNLSKEIEQKFIHRLKSLALA